MKRLQKEIKDKEVVEADLRKKIKDLILHEDFTKEELENLQKRESQYKSQYQAEKTKRQDFESLLKKEEELRKTKETQLADERRRNQNTSELEQAKLRIRQLEIERDGVREVNISELLRVFNETFFLIKITDIILTGSILRILIRNIKSFKSWRFQIMI